ncbi:hypothetical protein DXG01_007338 [Tephrocybe rancida]|nr:hypothetical protein DXG01_007338 [Tephrocybe rancida]
MKKGNSEKTEKPPWDAWKLDKGFLSNLAQYNTKHPDTTLDHVLDGIRFGLEAHQPLFSLIPDSPFPARGLVGALAHLIKLGVTVHRARASVRDFAEQVVAWVHDITTAFVSTVGGHFTWTTWKNLRKMRDLIDEICRWANSRLCDKRWTRIGNGMMIANEIAEFNARINEAKGLFTDLTLINLSGGLDAIRAGLWLLLQLQDNITKEINRIKVKQREQFSYILDAMEAQKQADARRSYLAQKLSPRVVPNPMYDQQGKLPCDEDTRTQVLADIRTWVDDISADSPNFLWLTGDPGCGKSAITASIARECKDRNVLWGQYFINRNNVETTDPNSYFPSIARQFADHSVDVEACIHDNLKRKPSLMDRISPEQAAELFVDAIGVASKLYPDRPVVIVIDGLDETDRARLKDTAIIFAHLFEGLSLHRNAKVLVSSRTEDDIRNPFARQINDVYVKHIHLDTASQSSIDDVSGFLRRKIARIVEDNDLNWEDWPGDKRMDTLTLRASGLFIWAVTVSKFIQEQIDTMGTECLDDVLDMLDTGTLGDINTLYSIILRETYKTTSNGWEFMKFRRIVGAIVDLCEPLCLEDLGALLGLRQTPSSSPVDIVTFVRRLRTVLVAGTGAIDKATIPRLHKSFYEFITSQHADSRFRVDLEGTNGELAVCCLLQFKSAHLTTACQPWLISTLPAPFRYAFRFWLIHLRKRVGESAAGVMMMKNLSLTREDCHDLLKTTGNHRSPDPVHITFTRNQSRILATSGERRGTWDTTTGLEIKDNHRIFKGHKDYVSSVAFSPDSKRLVSGSADKTAIVWDVQSGLAITPLKGHSRGLHSVKYSPDGRHIASGSEDFTVRIWDTHTHLPVKSHKTHTRPVRAIACSPDGKHIFSGSDDHSIRVWGWEGGPCQAMTPGHLRPVTSVTISPDGKLVASSSEDSTVILWDAKACSPLGKPLQSPRVYGLQFSPTGSHLAAIDGETGNAVYLWKIDNKPAIVLSGRHLVPPVERICSISFSSDESSLILGCDDHSIRIVNISQEHHHSLRFVGHVGWVMAVTVSPDGKYIASGSVDNNVHVWDMPVVGEILRKGNSSGGYTSFSPDGALVLSSSPNGLARLWKSQSSTSQNLQLSPATSNGAWIKHICFSPDHRRIAGVCSEPYLMLHLWDVDTGRLVASAVKGTVFESQEIVSLSFTPDSRYLVLTYRAAPSGLWEEKDGALARIDSSQARNHVSEVVPPVFFDTQSHGRLDLQAAVWFPSLAVSGLWVFLDNCIVRAEENGSISVLRLAQA